MYRTRKSESTGLAIGGCIIAVIILVAIDFGVAWVFQMLWNWLIPAIFHGPSLTYWRAFGLVMLLSIIGGFFKSSSSKGK